MEKSFGVMVSCPFYRLPIIVVSFSVTVMHDPDKSNAFVNGSILAHSSWLLL